MRLFIALDVDPSKFRDGLKEVTGKVECEANFVEPEKMHLTLKFLGELERSRLGGLKEKLEFAKGFGGFPFWLRGLGAFPRPGNARVLWMGVDSPRLVRLASKVRAEFEDVRPSERRFHSHLTLARIKERCDLTKLVQEYEGEEFAGFRADSVALKESILTPSGPKYKTLHEVKL